MTMRVMGLMSCFGILRLMGSASQGQSFAPPAVLKMPKEVQPVYMMLMSHPAYFDAFLGEMNALPETNAQVQALGNLGNLPLIVLTAEQSIDVATLKAMGYDTKLNLQALQKTWLELQNELAALSINNEHIIVKDSSHTIELDQPQAVIDAIRKVVEMTR
jgi:pimeloyl-ACP methyl ester carboxylesterase